MSSLTRVASITLAFCTLSLTLGSAHAAGSSLEAYASLTNLQYSVTDLRPADGIAAGLSFDDSGTHAQVGGWAEVYDDRLGNLLGYDRQPSRNFGTVSPFGAQASATHLQPDNSFVGAYVEGNSVSANARLTQVGQSFYAEAVVAAVNFDLDGDGPPDATQSTFILAPHTQVTVTGQAKYGLMRLAEGQCDGCGLAVEAQAVMLSSEVFGRYFSEQEDPMFDQFERVEGLYDSFGINNVFQAGIEGQQGATKLLSLTFTNDSDEARRFGFIAATWVQAQALPVPEPETWGLVLSGLLLVGCQARWRRS